MIPVTPSLPFCLPDEYKDLHPKTQKDLLDFETVFNFLETHPFIELHEVSASTGFNIDRVNHLIGCCALYCIEKGLKPWYVNTGHLAIHLFAQKLNEKNSRG